MTPFYQLTSSVMDPSTVTVGRVYIPKEFLVDTTITKAALGDLVYFAYHGRCELTEKSSMLMASIGAQYGINSLVQYCLRKNDLQTMIQPCIFRSTLKIILNRLVSFAIIYKIYLKYYFCLDMVNQ